MSAGIFQRWYGVSAYQSLAVYAVGVFEILLATAMVLGVFKRAVYAIACLVKVKTIWAIAPLLFLPFASETGGRLSTVGASLPLFAVLMFLYAVRAWDIMSLAFFRRGEDNRT